MWEKHRIFTHDEVYGIIQQKTWIIHLYTVLMEFGKKNADNWICF